MSPAPLVSRNSADRRRQLGLRELAGCVLILVGMLLAEVPRLTQQHQL